MRRFNLIAVHVKKDRREGLVNFKVIMNNNVWKILPLRAETKA